MDKNLFLDDIRNPKEAFNYTKNTIYNLKQWDVVRNYQEFINWIEENGLPGIISFDHDLADFHYEYKPEDYENMSEDEMSIKFGSIEKSGLDCAKWLVNYCRKNKLELPIWYCHSMNPIGKQNIINCLKDLKNG